MGSVARFLGGNEIPAGCEREGSRAAAGVSAKYNPQRVVVRSKVTNRASHTHTHQPDVHPKTVFSQSSLLLVVFVATGAKQLQ